MFGLDDEIVNDAANLTADDIAGLSREGFKVVMYDTIEEFYLAEALWSPAEGKNWEEFACRFPIHEKRLALQGVAVGPSVAGAQRQ